LRQALRLVVHLRPPILLDIELGHLWLVIVLFLQLLFLDLRLLLLVFFLTAFLLRLEYALHAFHALRWALTGLDLLHRELDELLDDREFLLLLRDDGEDPDGPEQRFDELQLVRYAREEDVLLELVLADV